jgi:(1->4)-alpha-D-glucan 1-alpha-D-glucosylmutase
MTLFQQGSYIPLAAHGPAANHLCAFARQLERQVALAVTPRLCATLLGEKKHVPVGTEVWEQTYLEIPSELEFVDFRDVLTGVLLSVERQGGRRLLPAGRILRDFPVALLTANQGNGNSGTREGGSF